MNLFKAGLIASIICAFFISQSEALALESSAKAKTLFDGGSTAVSFYKRPSCQLLGTFTDSHLKLNDSAYKLEPLGPDQLINHSSLHVFSNYKKQPQGWVAHAGPTYEVLRQGKNGELISEISIWNPQKAHKFPSQVLKDHVILSYIVCN